LAGERPELARAHAEVDDELGKVRRPPARYFLLLAFEGCLEGWVSCVGSSPCSPSCSVFNPRIAWASSKVSSWAWSQVKERSSRRLPTNASAASARPLGWSSSPI